MNVVETEKKSTPGIRRLNVALSERAYSELLSASQETRRSMTELVRLALGVVKILLDAQRNGHRLIIATSDGQAVKEIVLPS